jgi:DNA processing protein
MVDDMISSAHPLLPPTQEEDQLAWLRLLRSRRVGVATFYRLMAEYGDAQTCLEHLPKIAKAAGEDTYAPCSVQSAQNEIKNGHRFGAKLVFRGGSHYPALLNDLTDAPPILWIKGRFELLARPAIALVGARNASSLGMRMSRFLATELGDAGYVVCSGLARGIDAAAHAASIGTGTMAVVGGGIDVPYPIENAQLMKTIESQGVILSEQPMGMQPIARHFPLRNRIISGVSQALVVIEAAAKSGSLITARNALDQGRDVYAVPGHPFDARASGCNMLIRDGAVLVRKAQDVIDALSPRNDPVTPTPAKRSLRDIADLHSQILSRLSPSPLAEDQIIRDLGISAAQAASTIVDLEIDGKIQRINGGMIALNVGPSKH